MFFKSKSCGFTKNYIRGVVVDAYNKDMNACVNWRPDTSSLYVEGYWHGANKLAMGIIENRESIDYLVYPTLFLYRHYIELKIKYLIADSREVLEEKVGFPKHHNMFNLWGLLKANINRIAKSKGNDLYSHITSGDCNKVDDGMAFYKEVDLGSMAFRYPKDQDGNTSLDGVVTINIQEVLVAMNGLKEVLDKIDYAIDSFRNH